MYSVYCTNFRTSYEDKQDYITGRNHHLEIVIGKVESILVEQSFWGRIFNYGTIKVSGTGAGTIVLHYIKRPIEFQRQVRAIQGAGTAPNS